MYDRTAGANYLQHFSSVMIVTGRQKLQCNTGLGKQPSYGTAITHGCTSKGDCGRSWARRWWTLQTGVVAGNQQTSLKQGRQHTPAQKLLGRERQELGGRADVQNEMERAVITGHYPLTCMALVKQVKPKYVLAWYFVPSLYKIG